MPTVHLVDYVAGNVRSLANAIEKVGYSIEWVKDPKDIDSAEQVINHVSISEKAEGENVQRLILPGVGHFGHCLTRISQDGYLRHVRKHIEFGKPFMGICVGLQALFEGSAENDAVPGLGIIPGRLTRFEDSNKSVPHIGWNSATVNEGYDANWKAFYGRGNGSKYYYVHSCAVPYKENVLEQNGWTVATARYGNETFVGAIGRGNVLATQFHPEKSGAAGLEVLRAFLDRRTWSSSTRFQGHIDQGLTRRVIVCLDVRTNDQGDLVVTKGDQYDVRDKCNKTGQGQVRNLGKPVEMARKYYEQGADEIIFLNITSFRNCPLVDLPMLKILRQTSQKVFVPLTIGDGIRDTLDADGTKVSALEVAKLYFNSGADKVSIGSDAVAVAEAYIHNDRKVSGASAIEIISAAYGNQAVVVSVDPRRVYVKSPADTTHHTIETQQLGPSGEDHCWYQCTTKGGREGRNLDVQQLALVVEALGAGEILLNCIDKDGSNSGFDLELIDDVKKIVKIPVIASSGAGVPSHFEDVFRYTTTDAALGAGMFHRGEHTVKDVKDHLASHGLFVRPIEEQL